MTKLPSPQNKLWQGIFAAIAPMPSLKPSQWAERHRVLSRESGSATGRWRSMPMQIEPMDSVVDPEVNETVLWWAAQTAGKTEVLNNITGFFMHGDPATILVVLPTVELAEAHSKEKIAPMIRDTPALAQLVQDPRSRDSGNTTAFKRYPGGNLAMVGANAPAGLAGRPRRVVLQDEVDRYPASAGTEGDPSALADKRAESFPNAVKVKTSTGTVKGLSKIENLYEQSDKRKWFVRHKGCDHEYVLLWEQVKWEDGNPETAHLVCPCCGKSVEDKERVTMVLGGKWKPTAPFKGVRGYWINGLNGLFRAQRSFKNRLHQAVVDFLKAKDGGPEMMRVFINTFLAETYEEDATKLDASELAGRAEDYTPEALPERIVVLTAAVDVQRDRIEAEVKGWAKDEESFGVQKVTLNGDTEKDEVWAALDEFLLAEREREDGVKLKVTRAFVDMGYRSSRVLSFCAPRIGRGVYPCRGINRVGVNVPPLLPAQVSRNNKARIPHWNVGVTVAKSALHDRIALPAPGARSMHFASPEYGFDAEYFAQFASEGRKIKYSYGQPYYIFEKANNSVRNEALDLNVYNLAALHSLFPIAWNKLGENLKKMAPRKPDAAPAAPPPPEEKPRERTLRGEVKPAPAIHKKDLAKAVAETVEAQAPAPAAPPPPPPKQDPPPVSYTKQMLARRPRGSGRGGFVGRGWR